MMVASERETPLLFPLYHIKKKLGKINYEIVLKTEAKCSQRSQEVKVHKPHNMQYFIPEE